MPQNGTKRSTRRTWSRFLYDDQRIREKSLILNSHTSLCSTHKRINCHTLLSNLGYLRSNIFSWGWGAHTLWSIRWLYTYIYRSIIDLKCLLDSSSLNLRLHCCRSARCCSIFTDAILTISFEGWTMKVHFCLICYICTFQTFIQFQCVRKDWSLTKFVHTPKFRYCDLFFWFLLRLD